MLRWIAIVLIAALPLRSGLAAVQFCPWMDAQVSIATPATEPAPRAMAAMEEDCPAASASSADCELQTACTITPVLGDALVLASGHAAPERPAGRTVYAAVVFVRLPDRVPIYFS